MIDTRIPLLDIGPLRAAPSGKDARVCIDQMDAACTDSGFFVVTGHGLDEQLHGVFGAARAFFALPGSEKQRVAMAGAGLDGYVPIGGARSGRKEMYDVGDGAAARWPLLPGFRESVEAYRQGALAVASDVLRGLAVALDVGEAFFADQMEAPQCYLRMLRYPPRRRRGVVTGAHTDYGAITLLATDGVPGLEISPVGGEWTPIEAPPGSLVVNLGDMLARWTNDRYASTPHRVVDHGGQVRYSIPFFVNPDPDTTVACLPSCVSADRPCRYEPITAAAFLGGRIDGTIPTGDGRHG